jgi:hypothetical protein
VDEIHEEIEIDMADQNRKPVVVNAAGGSHVTVNVSVKNYTYPDWLDAMVQEHVKWEE